MPSFPDHTITKNWIEPLVEPLSFNRSQSLQLTNYQTYLFDDYFTRFDSCIEKAQHHLQFFNDDVMLDHAEQSADDIKNVFDQFLVEIYSILSDLILNEARSNQELSIVFFVLYSIYSAMQEDNSRRTGQFNPLFYQTLRDFMDIYIKTVNEDLPLPEHVRKMFDEHTFDEGEFSR